MVMVYIRWLWNKISECEIQHLPTSGVRRLSQSKQKWWRDVYPPRLIRWRRCLDRKGFTNCRSGRGTTWTNCSRKYDYIYITFINTWDAWSPRSHLAGSQFRSMLRGNHCVRIFTVRFAPTALNIVSLLWAYLEIKVTESLSTKIVSTHTMCYCFF